MEILNEILFSEIFEVLMLRFKIFFHQYKICFSLKNSEALEEF